MVNMEIDKILTEELKRHSQINSYVTSILEQEEGDAPGDIDIDVTAEEGGDDLEMADVEAPAAAEAEGGDEGGDTDEELGDPAGDEGGELYMDMEGETTDDGGATEEIDVTDIVDTAQEASDKAGKAVEGVDKQSEKIDSLLSKLDNLESKLGEMDQVVANIEALEGKIESLRPPTQKEKLEMRSLDSGPFTQSPADFFDEKKVEMEKSGKNEYVLTQEDVDNYNDSEIEASLSGPVKEETNENEEVYERKLKVFR